MIKRYQVRHKPTGLFMCRSGEGKWLLANNTFTFNYYREASCNLNRWARTKEIKIDEMEIIQC